MAYIRTEDYHVLKITSIHILMIVLIIIGIKTLFIFLLITVVIHLIGTTLENLSTTEGNIIVSVQQIKDIAGKQKQNKE